MNLKGKEVKKPAPTTKSKTSNQTAVFGNKVGTKVEASKVTKKLGPVTKKMIEEKPAINKKAPLSIQEKEIKPKLEIKEELEEKITLDDFSNV